VAHQAISGEVFLQIGNFLRGKPCRVFAAPLDVRLFPQEGDKDKTVVQPDLLVICDREKLKDKRACKGAPDLAIEIVLPSDNQYTLLRKFNYYLEAGVREYWVINPVDKVVQVHILEENHYLSSVYHENDTISVSVLPGLSIELKSLWDVME
jgi:Uma2 family endonuclease